MTMQEMKAKMPKAAGRYNDFTHYQSKSAFLAEAINVSEKAREAIKNELSNVFTLDPHNSGQYVAATLYFGGAGVEPDERYRHMTINCTGEELECELYNSIKEAKDAIRAILAPAADEAAPAEEAKAEPKAKKAKGKSRAAKTEEPAPVEEGPEEF